MADRADSTTNAAARPSLVARILSRLRGDVATHPADEPATPHHAAAVAHAPGEPVPPLDPLAVREWLWGPGFIIPGDQEYVLGLVKPFAANPAMSMLDVAAGLGGPARAISEAFGTYITGLERDPEIARRGMAMSVVAGKQRHAPISAIDPETFELRTGAFDCIFGRGATYMVQDKERFMRVLILGMKPRGQLLLTDYVVEPTLANHPHLAGWAALQRWKPSLWTMQQYTDCLKSLGFDIRVTEDISAAYKAQIVIGWETLLQTVNIRKLPRAHQLVLLDEAERWVKTIMALDSGALKAFRFYALAGASRPPLSSIRKKK
jgi:hypothetical protein